MLIGLGGMALTYPRNVTGGGGAPTIPAPFTRVNGPADNPYPSDIAGAFTGWSVDSVSAISDETAFTCSRQGFTNTGSPTTYLDTMYVTRQVRAPAPNPGGATLSASTYALSENIWSTDTPSGSVTNNSDVKSPVPVAKWVTPGKYTVGNSIGGASYPVELVAGHCNARSHQEVACVVFRIEDGTDTITATVSAPTISGNSYDMTDVAVWALPDTDITALDDGLITVHADVYPWIGDSDSVLSSEDATNGWEFASLYYRKNPTLLATPPIVYVDPVSGNDTLGAVSTVDATAAASPVATLKGAIDRADAVFGAGATGIDNLQIMLVDGNHVLTTNVGTNRRQIISRVVVQRAPGSTSQSTVVMQSGTAATNMNLGTGGSLDANMAQRRGSIVFKDMTWQRNGANAIVGGNTTYPLEVHLEGMRIDRNTQTNHLLFGQTAYGYANGLTFVSSGNNGLGTNTTGTWAILRGIGTGHTSNMESLCVVGSVNTGASTMENISPRINNRVVVYNIFNARNASWNYTANDVSGVFNSYNVYEYAGTASQHSFSVSNDSATYSNDHVICHHNTYIGYFAQGRENLHYEDGPTARYSRRLSYIGNIHVSVFTKGDRFMYETNQGGTGIALGPTRLDNWQFLYAVGCRHNFAQFISNGQLGNNEAQVFQGMGSPLGVVWNNNAAPSGQTIRLDPLFTDYQGTTWSGAGTTPTAGAGGGDYTLQSSSPAKNAVADPIRPYTLDGVAVGVSDNMGALSAA